MKVTAFCLSLLWISTLVYSQESEIFGKWNLEPVHVGVTDIGPDELSDSVKYISQIDFIDSDFARITYSDGSTLAGVYTIKNNERFLYQAEALSHSMHTFTFMTIQKKEFVLYFYQRGEGYPVLMTQQLLVQRTELGSVYRDSIYGTFEVRRADGTSAFLEELVPY